MSIRQDHPSVILQERWFDRFAYAHIKGGVSRLFSNYPEEWQRRYLEQNYSALDPVVTDGGRAMLPFTWSGEDTKRIGGDINRIADEAADFGIRSGLSTPIKVGFGGAALLTLASEREKSDTIGIRDVAHGATATAYVHMNLLKFAVPLATLSDAPLSPREATCLGWASLGKTKAETAQMTGLSEKTVRFYLDRVMAKLEATNITHAVRIATERRLI